MENQFKCFLLLPLKEMTTRKLAVLLWSGSDILASISKFPYVGFETEKSEKEWQEIIEDKIKAKAKKLDLPKTLKNAILDMVRPISLDVKRWKETHQDFLKTSSKEIGLPDLKNLHWTPEGAIDYRKTAEELLSCYGLDVVRSYEIACYYCLEDKIRHLWDKLPENDKRKFENIKNPRRYRNFRPDLPFCWPRILQGKMGKLTYLLRVSNRNPITFHQFAFEHSAERGNKTAAEYFFQKLTNAEREVSLMKTARAVLEDTHFSTGDTFPAKRRTDLLQYLLSVTTPQQQMDIIKAQPIKVFSCFLDWPWQEIILENAELLWTFLSASAKDLLREIKNRFGDPYFLKWFNGFLELCPPYFRELYENKKIEYDVCQLSEFFESTDAKSIKEMLRNMTAADRVKCVFNDDAFMLFFQSFLMERLSMVELCMREAAPSKEDRRRLKGAFAQFLDRKISGLCVDRKFAGFFALFDETDNIEAVES